LKHPANVVMLIPIAAVYPPPAGGGLIEAS